LDTARSGVEILSEVSTFLDSYDSNWKNKFDLYVDGGIRRGSDIFKCLALGAKAVGIGRPSLYALAGYGEKGVNHLIDILRKEFIIVMKLMGKTKVS